MAIRRKRRSEVKKSRNKIELSREKFLTEEECERLLSSVRYGIATYPKNMRVLKTTNVEEFAGLYYFFSIMYHTGCRPSEALNITPMDLKNGSVYIIGLKGSRDRTIPLSKDLFKQLKDYVDLNKLDVDECLFPWGIRIAQLVFKKIMGNSNKTLRSLRHTMGVRLYKKHKDPKLVQQILGHVKLENTSIYIDFIDSEDNIRRVIHEEDVA